MYRYVAGHVDISGERLLQEGDVIEDPDQRLIDRGFVVPIEEAPASPPVTTNDKETVADATGN